MKQFKALILGFLLCLGAILPNAGEAQEATAFSQAELDQMLAPIALYPDTVLSHVLIAATYPLEIVQAARWSREHPGLKGEAAVAQVEGMNWDASVKALVAFPELLQRMDQDLEWTQQLGDAFLAQEADMVESIQYLRNQAYAQDNLKTNEYVRVVREKEYIYIEPAAPRVVYVPYYDPYVVYGGWRWSAYPPVYWPRPRGFSVSLGYYWGYGYSIAPTFYFSTFYWPRHQVVFINHHHYDYHGHHHGGRHNRGSGHHWARYDQDARHWQHNPQHRRGVSYQRNVDPARFVQADTHIPAQAAPKPAINTRYEQRDWSAQKRSALDLQKPVQPVADRRAAPSVTQQPDRGRTTANASSAPGYAVRSKPQTGGQRITTPPRESEPDGRRVSDISQRISQRTSPARPDNEASKRQPNTSTPPAYTTRTYTASAKPGTSRPAQPVQRTQPATPMQQAPVREAAPRSSGSPGYQTPAASTRPVKSASSSTPTYRTQPAQRQAPATQSAPTQRAAPVQRSTPAPAPRQSRPTAPPATLRQQPAYPDLGMPKTQPSRPTLGQATPQRPSARQAISPPQTARVEKAPPKQRKRP